MTPESRVKKIISIYLEKLEKELDIIGWGLYKSMFVPVGYGKRNQLDYTLCMFGKFVVIEAKAPGEWLTPLQRLTCVMILKAGGHVFIISGTEGLDAFKRWVERERPA